MAPETSASVHSLSNKRQAEAPLKWLPILALFCQKWSRYWVGLYRAGITLVTQIYVRRQSLTSSTSPLIRRASAQNGPHCKIGLGVAERGKRHGSMPLHQHVGSGETMDRDGIRFRDTPRLGMGVTSFDPSVPQKPLACQSAKFETNVQSLGRTCWPYPVLSTSGVQPSLRYARRTV